MTAGKWTYAKQSPTPGKKCKDCVAEGFAHTKRPAPYPGPRCASHDRTAKRNRRLASSVRHVEKTYGLTAEEYDALYAYQGGTCALCRRAKGTGRKRLAVDHDHHQAMVDGHDPNLGCNRCIRMLVCSTCNDILAHARSDPAFFDRGAAALRNWPARQAGITLPAGGPQSSVRTARSR